MQKEKIRQNRLWEKKVDVLFSIKKILKNVFCVFSVPEIYTREYYLSLTHSLTFSLFLSLSLPLPKVHRRIQLIMPCLDKNRLNIREP